MALNVFPRDRCDILEIRCALSRFDRIGRTSSISSAIGCAVGCSASASSVSRRRASVFDVSIGRLCLWSSTYGLPEMHPAKTIAITPAPVTAYDDIAASVSLSLSTRAAIIGFPAL